MARTPQDKAANPDWEGLKTLSRGGNRQTGSRGRGKEVPYLGDCRGSGIL